MGIAARHSDPDEPVGAQGLAMTAALGLGSQRKIDATRSELSADDLGVLANKADSHPRLGARKATQDRRHEARDDVVWHAEADLALELAGAHGGEQLVVLRHQPTRLRLQPLACRRQHQPAASTLEQPAVEQFLQPFDLLAGRGLAEIEHGGGGSDAP